jgi:hypothetical protein
MPQNSTLKLPNFAFIEVDEPQLVRLGTLAEQYFSTLSLLGLIRLAVVILNEWQFSWVKWS